MARFEVGRTYSTSFAGDHTLMVNCKIISRTDKTAMIALDDGRVKRRKISERNGEEWIYPLGMYSMCPVISADR